MINDRTTSPPQPKRGVIYIRVSTDDQVNGTSLDDQARQCTAAFETESLELARVFRDEGSSAKSADRAVLMEAIDFALDRKNQIGVLMVWKVDRLARNTEDHFAIRRLLRTGGVDLRSATEPIGDDPSAKLFEVMVAGFAEFDNSVRRLRCVNGMRARIRQGIWPFKAPLGYRNRSLARRDVKKTDPDPVDPVIFPVLQRLLKGYARGHVSQSEMVQELRAIDLEALTGTKPTLQFVDHLMTNQLHFYAGWLRDSLGTDVELHRGRHEPMITEEEMAAIERVRAGRARIGIARPQTPGAFLLKGLIRCDDCGRFLTASRPRGRSGRYAYYHCFNRACPLRNKTLPKDELEALFEGLLRLLKPRPELLTALAESIILYRTEKDATRAALVLAQAEQLRALEARRAKILEMAETGVYAAPLVKERITAVDVQRSALKLAVSAPDVAQFDPDLTVAEAGRAIDAITANWRALDEDVRQRFQKIAFPEGISYARNTASWNREPARIFTLNRTFDVSDSHGVDLMRLHSNQLIDEMTQFARLFDKDVATEVPNVPTSPTSKRDRQRRSI